MTEGWRALVAAGAAVLAIIAGVSAPSVAGQPERPPPRAMKLGYVELADDARYANRGAHSGIVFTDLGRPY